MRGARILAVAAAASLCLAAAATAQEAQRDPRLRVIPYEESQVIAIDGHLGYQMMIEFDPQERIENVSIGDSLGWQVTPNRAATLLFLKPVMANAATNMTVVTTRRRYAFSLRAREPRGSGDPDIIYSLRFTYPEAAAEASDAPPSFNFDYAITGPETFASLLVFDDGRFTYFQLPAGVEAPAIFAVNSHGEEEVVNAQVRGAATVVEQLADVFVLRHGRDAVFVRRGGLALEGQERTQRRVQRGRSP
jgi:type IV secretion system protein VirB9